MITYDRIIKACKGEPYALVLRGVDVKYVTSAVNQGIDAHLESCFVAGRDRYETRDGGPVSGAELHCRVSPQSLPVLLRRLAATCDEAHLLASDILGTLEIEGDAGDIVSPNDETTTCALCKEQTPIISAHRHQDAYVGECCWDERLKQTE